MKNKDIHLEILKLTVQALGELTEKLVFLGGSTISLYITEPEVVQIRETLDVDCVVEVSSKLEYEDLIQKLREKGFSEDFESKVICRYKKGELILDVMPADSKILGFTNKWYKTGIENAIELNLGKTKIKVFSPAFLLASKIEAFKGRGKGSFWTSSDIEDIVTVFDGRSNIAKDLMASPSEVRNELNIELDLLIKNADFLDALEAHISDRQSTMGRKKIILNRIQSFLDMNRA
jgi:hypothetical protein